MRGYKLSWQIIYGEYENMAKMMGPRFKQSRRLGLNVCGHPKANKRMGKRSCEKRQKLTEYGLQLLENKD